MSVCILKMFFFFYKIDVTDGINVNKTSASKSVVNVTKF